VTVLVGCNDLQYPSPAAIGINDSRLLFSGSPA